MQPLPVEPKIWTDYLPGPPSLQEFVGLVLLVAALYYGGKLIKRHWTQNNEPVPFFVAILLWIGMLVIYLGVAGAFYVHVPNEEKATILAWFFVAWIFPAAHYGYTVVNSLAVRTVDHIGPFSARIDDPSEFAAARKLALRGEIDSAVATYRGYADNQPLALFEAARLLKAEDRFLEAALLLEEIADRFQGRRRVWAEATYQLAKLREVNMGEIKAAMLLLRSVMQRAPETRFGQLAANDLSRLQVLDESFLDELAGEEEVAAADPFYKNGSHSYGVQPGEELPARTDGEEPIPVPPQDPFFVARRGGAVAEPEASEPKPARKRSAKATPKKKAPATPKPPKSKAAKPKKRST